MNANIQLSDLMGMIVRNFPLPERGARKVSIETSVLQKGLYIYSLIIDGKIIGTRRMMVL